MENKIDFGDLENLISQHNFHEDIEENSTESVIVKCPFCGEDDYDLIGLKHHLITSCEAYAKIKQI